ncbi:MAG: hypothetical protein WA532_04455 [Candidatus Korobacteraceae bacterium]
MNMRKFIVLASAVVLSAACTMAQYGGGFDERSQDATNLIIVEGCLGQSVGAYKLTDPAGAKYQLTGKTEKLKEHVGQTIRVTATSAPSLNAPGSMSEGTEMQPTLSVISFKRLSDVCTKSANNIP